MEFEFCARAEVVNDTYSKIWKNVLTIGIVLSLFVMVVEYLINRRLAWIFLIPLMYLFSARRKVGVKTAILDVDGFAQKDSESVKITLFHVVKNKEGFFDRVLTLDGHTCVWHWDEDTCEFAVRGTGKLEVKDKENHILVSEQVQDKWMYFYLDQNYAESFRMLFSFAEELREEI